MYEMMEITPGIKEIMSKKVSTEDIKAEAMRNGMETLTMGARDMVLKGITSISEMYRVSADE